MDKLRRVVVYVAKDRSSPQKVQFLQSVTALLGSEEEELEVNWRLEKNHFILFRDRQDQVPLKAAILNLMRRCWRPDFGN